jgi:UDP-N-acetyl-D-glucosamine dehydrogenase
LSAVSDSQFMKPAPSRRQVVLLGQGYVGLTLAMRAVEVGHAVVGFDLDEERVKRLAAGEPQTGDVTPDQLTTSLATGRYKPTSRIDDCARFDVAVIAVPTPLREGVPDLSHIEAAAVALAPYVRARSTVVLESTTYPGTTEEMLVPLLEAGSGLGAGIDFHVGYSPERIDPGNRTWTLVNTPKVVSGIDDASLQSVQDFYEGLVDQTVALASPKEAELTKLLENTFRHVNVALVNELAMFANDLGIDFRSAIDAASTKPFGFMRFEPGPGVGGHCLPIDPSYLAWRTKSELGRPFRFVELATDVNDHMPDYVVRRLVAALNRERKALNGSQILLLGVSYKRNTADARETPAVEIARQLLGLGADVRAVDPHVAERWIDPPIPRVELTRDELSSTDAVILITDHDVFDYDAVLRYARYVLDTRHRLTGPRVEHL